MMMKMMVMMTMMMFSEAGVFPVGWICMMIRIKRMWMIRMKIDDA